MIPETPAEIRAVLAERGIRPRRTRGQNFLADRNLRDLIVRAAGVGEGDLVLEIGPGLGTLTRGLLATGASVVAVELDARLADFLEEGLAGEAGLELIRGDALEGGDLAPVVREAIRRRRARARRRLLVANLPYSAASAVLVAEARSESPPDLSVVMLQREVALRAVAAPRSADYGPLAVLLTLRGEGRILREVGGRLFVPPTDVRSAVVEIVTKPADRAALLAGDRAARECFKHRRKTLRRALDLAGVDRHRSEKALEALGIDPGARPEALSPEDFVAIGLELFPSSA